jgi:hypothetical protein
MWYEVDIDLGADGTYSHVLADVTAFVISLDWSAGFSSPDELVAPPSSCRVVLDNRNGEFLLEKVGAAYRGLLRRELLVRVRASKLTITGEHPTDYHQLWVGYVTMIQPQIGESGMPVTVLDCQDLMLRLLDASYTPVLALNKRTDEALTMLMDAGIIHYPYTGYFWVLDVGALGTGTRLPSSPPTDFEVGGTTLAFVGDVQGASRGNNAQWFARDIMQSECGGRFFWDARAGEFAMHNRYHDAGNRTALVSLSLETVEGYQAAYGDMLATTAEVSYTPRTVGTPDTVLWAAADLPITIEPNKERSFRVSYEVGGKRAALYGSGRVSYSGTGVDRLFISFDASAREATLKLTNGGSSTVSVSALSVLGTPLIIDATEVAVYADAERTADYGRVVYAFDAGGVNDGKFADDMARHLVQVRNDVLPRISSVSLPIKEDEWYGYDVLSLTIGDTISIVDSYSSHNGRYSIIGEQHSVNDAGHMLTLYLASSTMLVLWTLDDTTYSKLGETSALAL